MQNRWLALPLLAGLTLAGAGFIGYGSRQRDGARLLDQVVTRLHREAIDSASLDDIYEKARPRTRAHARRSVLGALLPPGDVPVPARGPGQLVRRRRAAARGPGRRHHGHQGVPAHAGRGGRREDGRPDRGGGWPGGRGPQARPGLAADAGNAGTGVALTLARDGVAAPLEHRLVRAVVHVPSVPFALMLDDRVGYVPLQRFNDVASQELGRAVQQLQQQGAKGLILDLRGNPGGDLDESIRVANLFLPEGSEVVEVRYRSRPAETRTSENAPVSPDLPLVVLTDSSTASASEIVAGALQDHDRAVLLGSTSFGKGVVQTLFPLDQGWYLKITNAKWYTPSGRSIQRERHRGAPADSVVPDGERPVFRSDAGRAVYGGGGIVPDVTVFADTLLDAEQQLQRLLSAKPKESNAALAQLARQLRPRLRPDFQVQPAWRDSVFSAWSRAGVGVTRAQFDAGRPLVDRLITQRLSRTVFGDSTAFRRWVPEDAQVRKAMALLESAGTQQDLLTVAAK